MAVISFPFSSHDRQIIRTILMDRQGTIVYPTETYYAIGCAAHLTTSVQKIYSLKQRAEDMPLLVLVDDWEMVKRHAAGVDLVKEQFLRRYWPGPLTAVLETKGTLARNLNNQSSTLGFRMTSSPVARDLIRCVGVPLVGTSANRSSAPECTEMDAVMDEFGDQVDLYIDGGKTPGGKPSTLVDMSRTSGYTVLRKGAVTLE